MTWLRLWVLALALAVTVPACSLLGKRSAGDATRVERGKSKASGTPKHDAHEHEHLHPHDGSDHHHHAHPHPHLPAPDHHHPN